MFGESIKACNALVIFSNRVEFNGIRCRETSFRVAKDQGAYFIDQNTTAHCAAYPTEALFRSLAVMQPHLSMWDLDLMDLAKGNALPARGGGSVRSKPIGRVLPSC
jgi:hypothetical protein